MPALARITVSSRTPPHFRKEPKADSCTAAVRPHSITSSANVRKVDGTGADPGTRACDGHLSPEPWLHEFRTVPLAPDTLRVVNSLIGIFLHCWRKHDAQEDCDRGRFGTGTLRRGGSSDAAQGRNHSHDGALWLEFHQHGHSHDTARPGRDIRQRSAPVALHLGL